MVTMNRNALGNMAFMENEPDDTSPSDLTGYIAPLKRRWWLLVLVPLLLALGAYELTSLRAPTYSATATLLVNPIGAAGSGSNDATGAALLTKTYSDLVTSPPILQRVITDLKLSETPAGLASLVTVSAEPSSQVIRISTKYRSAQTAADITNAVADRFIAFLTDIQKTGVTQSSQALRDNIDKARADRDRVSAQLAALRALPDALTAEQNAQIANLDSLLEQYQGAYTGLLDLQQRLNLSQFSTQNSVGIAVRAAAPQRIVDSLRLTAPAGALLAGLGATVAGIVLTEQARPRVRSRKDVRRVTDLTVLSTVPQTRYRDMIEVVHEPRSSMSEAIYSIQTQIQLGSRRNEATTVTLTSPGSDEGASLIAANLAVAFAQAGERVVLVDGNLRTPSQWKRFKKDAKHPGLAELIAVPALGPRDVLTGGPHRNMQLLLAGPVSVIPTERLTGERLDAIIADLRGHADVVIIDAPPVLTSSDTLLYAATADHAVIVVGAGRTRVDALRTTLTSIQAMKAHVLGVALYNVDGGGSAE